MAETPRVDGANTLKYQIAFVSQKRNRWRYILAFVWPRTVEQMAPLLYDTKITKMHLRGPKPRRQPKCICVARNPEVDGAIFLHLFGERPRSRWRNYFMRTTLHFLAQKEDKWRCIFAFQATLTV